MRQELGVEIRSFDWARVVFAKWAVDKWRTNYDKSTVARENIHLITRLFLDKTSKLISENSKGISDYLKKFNPLKHIKAAGKAYLDIYSLDKKDNSSSHDDYEDHREEEVEPTYDHSSSTYTENPYYTLIIDIKNVKLDNPNHYMQLVAVWENMIEDLLNNSCPKITSRKATPDEVHELKLFDPKKIQKEIKAAEEYVNQKIMTKHKYDKQWNIIYRNMIYLTTKLVDEVMKSVYIDGSKNNRQQGIDDDENYTNKDPHKDENTSHDEHNDKEE